MKKLEYVKCDDWLIFFCDLNTDKMYFVCTELWPEWANLHENADQEDNAIEKYMLPIALKKLSCNQLFGLRDAECSYTEFMSD